MSGRPPPPVLSILKDGPSVRVYAAQLADGTQAAVKQWKGGDAGEKRLLQRERRLTGLLNHPGLPRKLCEGEEWFALERLGSPLDDLETQQSWGAPAQPERLLMALADVLAYLHARGIAHNDIKPGNILFRQSGEPVLIDLGIATLSGEPAHHPDELAGSPAWMAPERILDNHSGPEADIWSLGAVIAWLSTGIRPFSGSADEVLDIRRGGAQPAFLGPLLERRGPGDATSLVLEMLGPADLRPSAAQIVRRLGMPGRTRAGLDG